MAKEGKIIGFGEDICLFCGQPKKERYEEYEKYYECDCKDAQKKREIQDKIQDLKSQLPREKFEIREESVLYKVNK
jgi:hypothetical protein